MNIVSQQTALQTEIAAATGAAFEQCATNEGATLHAVLMHTQLLLHAAMTFGLPQPLCDELAAEIDQLCRSANFV